MRVLVGLVWRLLFCSLAASTQLVSGVKRVSPGQNGASRAPFRRLPVFMHSSVPLIPPQFARPAPQKQILNSDLDALLFPAANFQHRVHGTSGRAVAVWCDMDSISVRVDRSLMSAWRVPARFRLGSCAAASISPNFLLFYSSLSDCGGEFKVVGGTLVYTYFLMYTPPAQGHVIRVPPLYLPILCHYNSGCLPTVRLYGQSHHVEETPVALPPVLLKCLERLLLIKATFPTTLDPYQYAYRTNRFHHSYKVAFRPQVQHATFMKSIRRELSFSLNVYNALWEPLSPGHSFFLGEQVYFVAQMGALLDGEKLYVDSCFATSSTDPNGQPKMDIINNYGCMIDGRSEDSSSQFMSRGNNFLKFSVDVFLFRTLPQVQYLHCLMSVGWMVSHTAKSCNYNKAAGWWEELDGSVSVCSCCDSMCGDRQPSAKNTVSSTGWVVEQKDETKSLVRQMSIQEEEGKEWLELTEKSEEGMNVHDKAQTFHLGAKIDHQDKKDFFVEKREWKLDTVSQWAKKEKENSQLKELGTSGMSNERKTREHYQAREKALDTETEIRSSSDKKIPNPSEHGSIKIVIPTRSSNLSLEYNTAVEPVSSTLPPDPTINPVSDSAPCCGATMEVQHQINDNTTELGNMNGFVRTESFTPNHFETTTGTSHPGTVWHSSSDESL